MGRLDAQEVAALLASDRELTLSPSAGNSAARPRTVSAPTQTSARGITISLLSDASTDVYSRERHDWTGRRRCNHDRGPDRFSGLSCIPCDQPRYRDRSCASPSAAK